MTKTKQKEQLFWYDIDLFEVSIVVHQGERLSDLAKLIKRKKNKAYADFIEENEIDLRAGAPLGIVYHDEVSGYPYLLHIKNARRNNWRDYEVLLHECVHLTDGLLRWAGATKEWELRAHLTQALFRDLRRRLFQ